MSSPIPFLMRIELRRDKVPSFQDYPFNLPAVRTLDRIDFDPALTFVVGENGSGKSTLLEAIAVSVGLNAEGGSRNFGFSTYRSHSVLNDFLRPVRGPRRPRDSFFLRAESFYNLATNIEDLDKEPGGTAPIINAYGGTSLHKISHGESFFALVMHRFRGNGLYILDEPEAALSPTRQLALLARMRELIEQGSQFIIATHSPILMGYPGARILVIGPDGLSSETYRETEHYRVTRRFLNDPDTMLATLGFDTDG